MFHIIETKKSSKYVFFCEVNFTASSVFTASNSLETFYSSRFSPNAINFPSVASVKVNFFPVAVIFLSVVLIAVNFSCRIAGLGYSSFACAVCRHIPSVCKAWIYLIPVAAFWKYPNLVEIV